jgi:protoheme IX farnesyltransferase
MPLGVAGWIYTVIASIVGLILFVLCLKGFKTDQVNQWARRLFLFTLVYLTLLFGALVIDAGPMGPEQHIPLPIFTQN